MLRPKRTFKVRQARGSVRRVSCDEFGCKNREHGWMIVLPVPAQQDMVDFIRNGGTNRHYTEKVESLGLITYYFDAGQDCFEKHLSLDPMFNVFRSDSEGRTLQYPDGDAFIWDSDTHLRKIKAVVEN